MAAAENRRSGRRVKHERAGLRLGDEPVDDWDGEP
jgi:hypothetical protein